MTIKEVEQQTGMSRANIRFYEKEGLLSAKRQENGYRTYSPENVQELEKLKLLRMLGIPLEEIRQAKTGERSLSSILRQRQGEISRDTRMLQNAQVICGQMCKEQVEYATLDAVRYLHALNGPRLPETDVIPRVQAPWRRFFARGLDLALYTTLFHMFIGLFTNISLLENSVPLRIVEFVVGMVLTMALEPVLLHFWGTTVGKWLLGLRLVSPEGRNLTHDEAWNRTWLVIFWGMGLQLPIYSAYRYIRSYMLCADGQVLPWEEDSMLVLQDPRKRRFGLFGLSCVLIVLLNVGSIYIQWVPDHRGDLELGDFAKNYNQMQKLVDSDYKKALDSEGNWVNRYGEDAYIGGNVVDDISQSNDPLMVVGERLPQYTYQLENGKLVAVAFRSESEEEVTRSLVRQKKLCVLAFVRAQRGILPIHDDTARLLDQLAAEPMESWEMEVNGVRVRNCVQCTGYSYLKDADYLLSEEGEKPHLEMEFSMELVS